MTGAPRVQYGRVVHVLPPDATIERVRQVLDVAYPARQTVGFSYDDAGVGALEDRTAVLWDIPADKRQAFIGFYAQYYPGVELEFRPGDTPPPPATTAFPLGVNAMYSEDMAREALRDGARIVVLIDSAQGAVNLAREFPDRWVVSRIALEHDYLPDPADFVRRAGVNAQWPANLIIVGLNEDDQGVPFRTGIEQRYAWDSDVARRIRAINPNVKYAAWIYPPACNEPSEAQYAEQMRRTYAAAYNNGEMWVDMHPYGRDEATLWSKNAKGEDEYRWFEGRVEHLFACSGFDPNGKGRMIYTEAGVDKGSVGGFAQIGFTPEQLRTWLDRFAAIHATYPQVVGAALFQYGDHARGNRWAGYELRLRYREALRAFYIGATPPPPPPPPPAFKFDAYPSLHPDRVITQAFGANPAAYKPYGLPGHDGVDLRAPTGTQIVAVAPGTVTVADRDPTGAYGIWVEINHGEYRTAYAHLQSIPSNINAGVNVAAGQLIGIANNTGNSSGAHLHLRLTRPGHTYTDAAGAVWPNNIHDPTPYLQPFLAPAPPPPPVTTVQSAAALVGVHCMTSVAAANEVIAAGARAIVLMDQHAAAYAIAEARQDVVVFDRRYFRDPITPEQLMTAFGVDLSRSNPNDRRVMMGINEYDVGGFGGSPAEIQKRAEFDRRMLELVERHVPNAWYAGGGYPHGTPDMNDQAVCDAFRAHYAPLYNARRRFLFRWHNYTWRDIQQVAPIWYERRWEFLFTKCGFDPSIRAIATDETGVEGGDCGSFAGCGWDDARFTRWLAFYLDVQRQPLNGLPSPMLYGCLFQRGGNGDPQWDRYEVARYMGVLRQAWAQPVAARALTDREPVDLHYGREEPPGTYAPPAKDMGSMPQGGK